MTKTYVLPFALYLLGTNVVARFGDRWYPLTYSILVAIVLATTWWLLRHSKAIQPHWKVAPAVGVGLLGIVLWILLSKLHLEQMLGQYLPSFLRPEERVGYNPFSELSGDVRIWSFIAIRLVGIAVLVPIAEELFWRGFLLRWLIDPEWKKIPLGEYTLSSCMLVTLLFTLAHPEWLAAASYCLLINGLLYWKRDLWLCVVAHAVSNLALAIYVLSSGDWWLW